MGVVRVDKVSASDELRRAPASELSDLNYGHRDIMAFAVDAPRSEHVNALDPADLSESSETIRHLRLLHEAVLGKLLVPDPFRCSMRPFLRGTGRAWQG